MIMKRYLTILVLALFSVQAALDAQELTNKERRLINLRILDVIEEYERTADLADSEEKNAFLNLFHAKGAKIFCDLIGTKEYLNTISIDEYLKQAEGNAKGIITRIYDIRKGGYTYDSESGKWIIDLRFRKDMSFTDVNDILFSAEDFYEGDIYDIRMKLAYDQATEDCRIVSIDGNIKSQKKFPEGKFLIINRNDGMSDRDRKYMNELFGELEYNSFGQAFVENPDHTIDDPDVVVKKNIHGSTDVYYITSYDFKRKNGRFKLRYGGAPKAYSVKDIPSIVEAESYAHEFSAEIGSAAGSGNWKFLWTIGGGYSVSGVTLGLADTLKYSQKILLQDPDGWYRNKNVDYEIASAGESRSYRNAFAQLRFGVEGRIGKWVVLSGTIGPRFYYALPSEENISDYYVAGSRTIDGRSRDFSLENIDEYLSSAAIEKYPINFSVIGSFEVDVRLVRRLYASVSFGYEHGLNFSHPDLTAPIEASTGCMYDQTPLIYDPVTGKSMPCHSLFSNAKIYRSTFWLGCGLKVNF